MSEIETGWYRTEGGSILLMDHPLSEPIAARVAKGEITRVANEKGDPYAEPEETKPKRGAKSATDPAAELKAAQAKLAEQEKALAEVTAERDTALAERDAALEAAKPAVKVDAVKAQK